MGFVTRLPSIHNDSANMSQGNAQERALFKIAAADPNQQRPELVLNNKLIMVARAYAERLARESFFSHVDPQGFGPDYRARQAGYSLPYSGTQDINHIESITAVYEDAQGAWNRWLESEHRIHVLGANDFFREQTQIGVGHFELKGSVYQHYWVFLSAPPESTEGDS